MSLRLGFALAVLCSVLACGKKDAPAADPPPANAAAAAPAAGTAEAEKPAEAPKPAANPLEDAKKIRAEAKGLDDMLRALSTAFTAVADCKLQAGAAGCPEDDPGVTLVRQMYPEFNTRKWQPDAEATAKYKAGFAQIIIHNVGSTHVGQSRLARSYLGDVELTDEHRTRLSGLAQNSPDASITLDLCVKLGRGVTAGDAAGIEAMRTLVKGFSNPKRQELCLTAVTTNPTFSADPGHVPFLVAFASAKDGDAQLRGTAVRGLESAKAKAGLEEVAKALADVPDGDPIKDQVKAALAAK